jgi:hypothetical protein
MNRADLFSVAGGIVRKIIALNRIDRDGGRRG